MLKNYRTRLTLTSLERRETPAGAILHSPIAAPVVVKADLISDPREGLTAPIFLGPDKLTVDRPEYTAPATPQDMSSAAVRPERPVAKAEDMRGEFYREILELTDYEKM